MYYQRIVYAYIIDQVFFNEVLKTGQLIASIVILIVAILTAYYKIQ